MTKKHKIWRSKHLLESKKDVDENVENILRMIEEENEQTENEQDDSGNPVKKSKLSSLVKGFHEDYEYLHKHYKQLISKLENVGHSSSSSDSYDSDIEGDRSENDVTTPKVALNEENSLNHNPVEYSSLEAEVEKLKQTTEEQANEISDLKQLLDKGIKDKEATRVELSSEVANLSSENKNLKVLLETAKREEGELLNIVKSKESGVTKLSSEKQIIEEERDNLKILIVDMEKEKEDTRNQLKDTLDKYSLLLLEFEKAQQAEKEVQTLLEENQKLKNDNMMLLVEHDSLKALHMNSDIECSQLKKAIAEICAENESLITENHSTERKLQQLEVEIDGLKVEVTELTNSLDKERSSAAEEKVRLVSENSMYLNELEKAQSSVNDLEKELESTKNVLNSNIAELQKDKTSAMLEIEQLETSLMNLRTELAQQLEKISDMQKTNAGLELANSNLHNEIVQVQGQKNEAVASIIDLESKLEQQAQEISYLQEANKDLKTAKTDLSNEVTTLQEEKNAALFQLQQSEANINNLESDMEQQQNQILLLQQENEELQNKNCSLHKQLEETRTNMQGEITALQGEKEEAINSLQMSNDSVKALGVQLEQRVEQISVLELTNEDLQNSNSNLKMQLEEAKLRLQAEILALQDEKNKILLDLQQSEASIKNFKIELEQGKEQISKMNLANEDLKNDIAILDKQLGDKYQLLEEENLSANKENKKLKNHVQDLEVQIQLAKQKLKVTEAESKCKEDSYATAVDISQAKIYHLEQLVQQFSGRVSLLEETLMQVNRDAESEVSELADKLNKLESLFSQSFALFVDRSSACGEELKVLRKKMHDHLDEHKELVKENDEMASRLRERENMVSDMAKSAAEAEAKMVQLKKAVAEKEEELAARVQEKREAIKQLSDTIVYHKNYSDDLVRYIRSHNRPRLPFCL